jgi:hypothetical protein
MIFLIAGFGFLLAEEWQEGLAPYSGRASLIPLLRQGSRLLWQVLFLLLAYPFFARFWIVQGNEKEPMIFFFFLGAYALGKIPWGQTLAPPHRGSLAGTFLCVFSLCYYAMTQEKTFSLWEHFLHGGTLALGVSFFQILILGLKDKLLFSSVPKPLEGLPILFLTASLIALALLGL